MRSKTFFSRLRFAFLLATLAIVPLALGFVSAQEEIVPTVENSDLITFPIGEKITYNITFEKFKNAGYAEIQVVSTGKLGDKDAVELRSKFKTDDLASVVFYLIDETRKTFADSITGLPLFVKKTIDGGIVPEETSTNYMTQPTLDYDLLTLIYRVRNNGGVGSFTLREGESSYPISFQNTTTEFVQTPAGDFETSISTVESEFLVEHGITKLRVNFSLDESRTPVLIRFTTAKGDVSAKLASLQTLNKEAQKTQTPTPIVAATPTRTPTPIPTPTPFVENQPLSRDLPFVLGETLEYKITNLQQPIGSITFEAKKRRLFQNEDSLLLAANVTTVEPGNQLFKLNDRIEAQVDPSTLAPRFVEFNFGGLLSSLNQVATFDHKRGIAVYNGTNQTEIPVGSHSLLSLFYAVRSFNLKPSADANNEVNDTRVAVYMDGVSYIFTLRPSNAQIINFRDEKISAQLITIKTTNPTYDRLNLRLWLSTDDRRVPLRFSAGNYQADLVSQRVARTEPMP